MKRKGALCCMEMKSKMIKVWIAVTFNKKNLSDPSLRLDYKLECLPRSPIECFWVSRDWNKGKLMVLYLFALKNIRWMRVLVNFLLEKMLWMMWFWDFLSCEGMWTGIDWWSW